MDRATEILKNSAGLLTNIIGGLRPRKIIFQSEFDKLEKNLEELAAIFHDSQEIPKSVGGYLVYIYDMLYAELIHCSPEKRYEVSAAVARIFEKISLVFGGN